MNNGNYCLILAGGIGQRLWPVSRSTKPKQFLDLFGTGRTLLQQTYDRIARFIDADKMDYLERDAINCGVSYGKFDRDALVNNLTMIKGDNGIYNLALKRQGVQALEGFILARYYMFSQVYMHPNERILRFQYCQAMKKLLPNGVYPDDVKKFLALDNGPPEY
jgi:HD superfamily phosphohydrolase